MLSNRAAPGLTGLTICTLLFGAAIYFTFAAVQGDFGIFKRVQVETEIDQLRAELRTIEAELAEMRNKTRRLSDDYLDLDLLDTQARSVLGMMRSDEILFQ